MQCPHCAAEVQEGVRFCPSCRKRVVAPTPGFDQAPPRTPAPRPAEAPVPPAHPVHDVAPPLPPLPAAPAPPLAPVAPVAPARQIGSAAALAFGGTLAEIRRPGAITALAVWDFLQGAVLLLMAAVMALVVRDPEMGAVFSLAFSAIYLLLGIAHVAAGIGLLKLRNWGRILQIVLSALGLLNIPCGTVISIFILVYLLKPGIAILFSGRTDELTPEEAGQVAQALQSNAAMWAIMAVVGSLVAVAMIGIIAAIAIPSLLRARISANESGTIGRLRTVISAQAAFESAAGGFATLPCLQQPQSCVTGWTAGPLLHEGIVFDRPASGYVLRFHPGPPAVAQDGTTSPHVIQSYAVTGDPASVQGGVRRFCADSSGVVFVMPEGAPPPQEGLCSQAGQPLQ